jgi:hypothetical protein
MREFPIYVGGATTQYGWSLAEAAFWLEIKHPEMDGSSLRQHGNLSDQRLANPFFHRLCK